MRCSERAGGARSGRCLIGRRGARVRVCVVVCARCRARVVCVLSRAHARSRMRVCVCVCVCVCGVCVLEGGTVACAHTHTSRQAAAPRPIWACDGVLHSPELC
jgi:hypothetical protein